MPNPPADASAFQYSLVEVVSKTPVTAAAPLEGTTWQLIAYLDAAGSLTLPYREAPATLTMADGQLRILLKRVNLLNCDAALPSIQMFI